VPAAIRAPVLLWCHGNAGNIINRLENLIELHRTGLSVYLFDYRGYGRSSGKPSERGLYHDALAAHDYLTQARGIRPGRLVLFGRSLGAAVAGELASRRAAAGLILESSFPSVA
jgi:pimeloyl-ACP methyl ester carboxylesterase